jgi:hypothetical protein
MPRCRGCRTFAYVKDLRFQASVYVNVPRFQNICQVSRFRGSRPLRMPQRLVSRTSLCLVVASLSRHTHGGVWNRRLPGTCSQGARHIRHTCLANANVDARVNRRHIHMPVCVHTHANMLLHVCMRVCLPGLSSWHVLLKYVM